MTASRAKGEDADGRMQGKMTTRMRHTAHEGQRTDMSNFMDQVTMMQSWREPRPLRTARNGSAPPHE